MIKRRGRSQIGNLTSDHKLFESMGQMSSNWGVLYNVEKIFLRVIIYFHHIFKIDLIEKYMSIQTFGTTKVTILGLPFGSLGGK
jgi:hypothetical protein